MHYRKSVKCWRILQFIECPRHILPTSRHSIRHNLIWTLLLMIRDLRALAYAGDGREARLGV
jgi:hypothetical protein